MPAPAHDLSSRLNLLQVLMAKAIKSAENIVIKAYQSAPDADFLSLMERESGFIACEVSSAVGFNVDKEQLISLCSARSPGESRGRWYKLLATLAALQALDSR